MKGLTQSEADFVPVCPDAEPPGETEAGPAGAYRQMQLVTAAPRRLQMMLYDGAIRLCGQALRALDAGDVTLAADRLGRARGVIRQLRTALRDRARTESGESLAKLYDQVHKRLIEADFYRRREPLRETIAILRYQRPAWTSLVETLGRTSAAAVGPSRQSSWLA